MADAPNNGGPAFPNPGLADPTCSFQSDVSGMTLRDWFAGQALIGVVQIAAKDPKDEGESRAQYFSRRAYEVADAMLAAREVPHG